LEQVQKEGQWLVGVQVLQVVAVLQMGQQMVEVLEQQVFVMLQMDLQMEEGQVLEVVQGPLELELQVVVHQTVSELEP
jgi:CheY-like chemotaxis protein